MITIIGILAALVLGVAAVAADTARQARSEAMVGRVHTLLVDYWDSFRNRRVELRSDITENASGRALAEARLYGLRETLILEVPDRWSDLLGYSLGSNPADTPPEANTAVPPAYLAKTPALAQMFLRRYAQIQGDTNKLTGAPNTVGDLRQNQGAEMLYMIITMATADGEARGMFKESEVGDTDGDGAPEFLDGWGNPIQFLRWAPGTRSEIQLDRNDFDESTPAGHEAFEAAVAADRDPFDLFRSDVDSFRMVPLIVSPGADEELGIYLLDDSLARVSRSAVVLRANPDAEGRYWEPPILPQEPRSGTHEGAAVSDIPLGTPVPDETTSTDNITNHLLTGR